MWDTFTAFNVKRTAPIGFFSAHWCTKQGRGDIFWIRTLIDNAELLQMLGRKKVKNRISHVDINGHPNL